MRIPSADKADPSTVTATVHVTRLNLKPDNQLEPVPMMCDGYMA
jgi:hypothetical protein